MQNIKFKRIMAYLIDIFIVSLIVTLLTGVKFLNPKYKEYQKTLKEYNEYVLKYEEELGNTTVDNLNMNSILTKEYVDLSYDLSRYGLSYTIAELAVIVLYFTIFPFLFDGQTLGKRILKIRIVNEKEEKATIFQHLLRSILLPMPASLLLYTGYSNLLLVLFILLTKGEIYVYSNLAISAAAAVLCYVDIIMMFTTKNTTSLHDRIIKTKVIEC